MYRLFVAGLLFLICSQHALCQDSSISKRIKILPVPALGYSPETKTYIGAVCLFTFNVYQDSVTRSSNAKLELNYTWNKQVILEGGWNYFFKEENWFTKGLIRYAQYPDFYYGIGGQTPDNNKLVFNSHRFIADAFLLKKISHKLFTGINIKYSNYATISTENSALYYPELTENKSLGIGYSIVKDSRNNLLNPSKGIYLYANTVYNFSENNYWELMLDLRYYKTWNKKYTLASRLVNDFNFGTIPFYEYAFLGGDQFVRGYYYGRYRDHYLSSIQEEFRFPLFWKIGMTVFGGLSGIYSDKNPLNISSLKYNYGTGIRFLVDKKENTNLRIDYAIGQDNNSGIYISFGESF